MRIKLSLFVFFCFLFSTFCVCSASGLQDSYDSALELLVQGKYIEAANAFDALFGYEDATLYATYARALAAGESGNFDDTIKAFNALGDFRDSASQAKYYNARSLETSDEFWMLDEAINIYEGLGFFRDSYDRIDAIKTTKRDRYDSAVVTGKQGNYREALIALNYMDGYEQESLYYMYFQACLCKEEQDYYNVLNNLAFLHYNSDFEDSQDLYTALGDQYINCVNIGDTVSFGTNIWYVLDIDRPGKRLFLITTDTLYMNKPFCETHEGYNDYSFILWDNSSLRKWLNDYYDGFLGELGFEAVDLIESTKVSVRYYTPNQGMEPNSHDQTSIEIWDKAFALSVDEASFYLNRINALTTRSEYWLRDVSRYAGYTGGVVDSVCTVSPEGISYFAIRPWNELGVRPAVWVNFS